MPQMPGICGQHIGSDCRDSSLTHFLLVANLVRIASAFRCAAGHVARTKPREVHLANQLVIRNQRSREGGVGSAAAKAELKQPAFGVGEWNLLLASAAMEPGTSPRIDVYASSPPAVSSYGQNGAVGIDFRRTWV
jgi:hypothetical protein